MLLAQMKELVDTGQYAQAMRVFLQLLLDSSLPRQQLALAYHMASVAQHAMERYASALEYARFAEEHAQAAGDPVLLGKVWSNMVEYYRACGDSHMAAEYADKWLRNFRMYPELNTYRGRVHYNMALVQRTRRDYKSAFKHFAAAVRLMHATGIPVWQRVTAHQMYAWALYERERIREGDQQLQLAEEIIEPDDMEGHRELILLRCLRAYHTGDLGTVLKLTEEFLVTPALTTSYQVFWAQWMLGMAAVDAGMLEPAKAALVAAQELAAKLGMADLMNRATELRRAILVREQLLSDQTG